MNPSEGTQEARGLDLPSGGSGTPVKRRSAPAAGEPRGRVVTYLTPPRLSSFPAERAQLEYSSRSMVFPTDGDQILRAWGTPERPWVVGVEERGARWQVTGWG